MLVRYDQDTKAKAIRLVVQQDRRTSSRVSAGHQSGQYCATATSVPSISIAWCQSSSAMPDGAVQSRGDPLGADRERDLRVVGGAGQLPGEVPGIGAQRHPSPKPVPPRAASPASARSPRPGRTPPPATARA